MKLHWREFIIHIFLVMASLVLCLAILEIGSRLLAQRKNPRDRFSPFQSMKQSSPVAGDAIRMVPHPFLAFQPSDVQMTDDGGSIAGERFSLTKPNSVIRIACLGGSETMRAYPKALADTLKMAFPNKTFEVMDWGCARWTIIESMINYMLRARLFKPDFVIFHPEMNDIMPRMRGSFRMDYSHFRQPMLPQNESGLDWLLAQSSFIGWLRRSSEESLANSEPEPAAAAPSLRSATIEQPSDKTTIPFVSALDALGKMTQADGAHFILAGMVYSPTETNAIRYAAWIEQHKQIVRDFAEANNTLLVDLQSEFENDPSQFNEDFSVSQKGIQAKGNRLADALKPYVTIRTVLPNSVE